MECIKERIMRADVNSIIPNGRRGIINGCTCCRDPCKGQICYVGCGQCVSFGLNLPPEGV
jgi:hypothetical protein